MARKKKATEAKATETETVDLGTLDMGAAFVQTDEDLNAEQTTVDELFEPFELGFWHKDGKDVPSRATENSAGFDFRANLNPGDEIKFYDHSNVSRTRTVNSRGELVINPGERFLIPTGLHADIPASTYLAIHARSGTSWKQGLILTNGVAVIDEDYVEEIFISITNISGVRVVIQDGERIAQGLVMPVTYSPINTLQSKPAQKTSRSGGFGSTGNN